MPGKYDKEYLGLYTVIEQVDKTFLKDRFKNNKGLLMKPEGVRGVDYFGDDWDRYKARYHPKHDPSAKEAQRVIEFARLVPRADDAQFKKEIGSYLDVDEFLRFLAVNAFVVNMDSFFTMGHNYYIYLNPETNKFVYIPWDLDLSLAGFPMMGGPDQTLNLSMTHPHGGENKLIDRLLTIPELAEQYQKLLKELAATCFTKERLLKEVEAIDTASKEPLARERKAAEARKEGGMGFGPPGMMGRTVDLKTFVEKRTELVVAQIDGKNKGYVPTMGFGPGGRPGGFGIGNMLAKPLLEALDSDKDGKVSKDELIAGVKKFFGDCDKDKTGFLDEKTLAESLNRLFPQGPGFGRPGGPGGRPGAFGPGAALAGAIVKRADVNKDNKVTLAELIAAADALFKEVDKDRKGKLEEKDLAAAINLISPQGGIVGPGDGLAKPLLEALDADRDGKVTKAEVLAGVKKFFADCDKDRKGTLDEKALADGLNRLFPAPPGFGAPGGPGGFGPGSMLAGVILRRADTNKDSKVTLEELTAAAEAVFAECDKDKKGFLDEKGIAAGINLIFPPPPGFGPPPVRPEDPRKEEKQP